MPLAGARQDGVWFHQKNVCLIQEIGNQPVSMSFMHSHWSSGWFGIPKESKESEGDTDTFNKPLDLDPSKREGFLRKYVRVKMCYANVAPLVTNRSCWHIPISCKSSNCSHPWIPDWWFMNLFGTFCVCSVSDLFPFFFSGAGLLAIEIMDHQ